MEGHYLANLSGCGATSEADLRSCLIALYESLLGFVDHVHPLRDLVVDALCINWSPSDRCEEISLNFLARVFSILHASYRSK